MKNKHPVLRRFMRRKVSVVAAAVLILFVLIAILGPLVWQVDPLKQSVMKKYGPMTVQHPLGTDNLGRDTLARMIYGARVSLAISFAGVLSGALIGVLLGVSAGYFGGWVDAIISRFIDILLAFPGLLLAITIVAVLGPGSVNTVIAITIFTIPGLTRMVRSVVLSLKSSEYVEACKTMGESNLRIIFTHVIPNLRPRPLRRADFHDGWLYRRASVRADWHGAGAVRLRQQGAGQCADAPVRRPEGDSEHSAGDYADGGLGREHEECHHFLDHR